MFDIRGSIHWVTHLYKYDGQHSWTNGVHHSHVVGDQSLPTATAVEIELFWLVLVIKVGVVIQQVVLKAGARGAGVTAAEGNTVHQVAAVHVASYTTGEKNRMKQQSWELEQANKEKQWKGIRYKRYMRDKRK